MSTIKRDFSVSKDLKVWVHPVTADVHDYTNFTDEQIIEGELADWGDEAISQIREEAINEEEESIEQYKTALACGCGEEKPASVLLSREGARDKVISDQIIPNIYECPCKIESFHGNLTDEIVEEELEDNLYHELCYPNTKYNINCYCCTEQRLIFVIDDDDGIGESMLMFSAPENVFDDNDNGNGNGNGGAYYVTPVEWWIEETVKKYAEGLCK